MSVQDLMKEKKAQSENKDAAVKANAATQAAAPVETSPEEDAVLNSKRDMIEFMNPLGDPSKDDVTVKVVDGKKEKITTSTIVGYRFKALEDVDVPDCGLDEGFKKDRMNYIQSQLMNTKHVAKGQTFDLTPFELGMLMSRPEYNGAVTGGDKPMTCVYHSTASRSKSGTVKVSETDDFKNVSLRAVSGSIRDFKMIDVLSFKAEKADNGVVTKTRTINPGFEKWAPLCVRATRKSKGEGGSSELNKRVRNQNAQAFLELAKKKAGK